MDPRREEEDPSVDQKSLSFIDIYQVEMVVITTISGKIQVSFDGVIVDTE